MRLEPPGVPGVSGDGQKREALFHVKQRLSHLFRMPKRSAHSNCSSSVEPSIAVVDASPAVTVSWTLSK